MQKADVDDAVQSLLCKLYYASKQYNERKHAFSWIVMVFRNSILSKIKKEKIERNYLKSQEREVLLSYSSINDEYLSNYVFFKEVFSKLDKHEQSLAELVIVLGLSYNEVASLLKKSKSTIQYQIEKLKEKIKNMG